MEEQSNCEVSINSFANLNVSRRDLVKLRDRISYLDDRLRGIQKDEAVRQIELSEMVTEIDRLKALFYSIFGEQIKGVIGAEEVSAELSKERVMACPTPGQITLGMSEPTREQMLSIMDVIKRISEETGEPAPKEVVQARAAAIGITRNSFEEILARLRRAAALVESEGTLRLI